jgi:hypothetical protein
LPRDRLLLCALRLRLSLCLLGTLSLLLRPPLLTRLLGTLPLLLWLSLLPPLLLGLLSGLPVLLLLRLPLLFACLGPLRLPLRTLLLCGWPRIFPLPTLMLFRPVLPFVLLVVLRVRRDNRSEKQKHGGGTSGSNELHNNHLR